MGTGDVDEFLLFRLRRTLAGLEAQVARYGTYTARAARLRTAALAELSEATRHLRTRPPSRAGAAPPTGGA